MTFLLFNINTFANTPEQQTPPFEKIKEKSEKLSVDNILGFANAYSFKDLNTALALIDLAMQKAQSHHDNREIFDIQRDKGFIYEDNNQFSNALLAYQQAYKTTELIGDSAKLVIATDLGIISRKLGNYRAAYDYYDKNLAIAKRLNNNTAIRESYHGMAFLLKEVGVYDKAIDLFIQSLDIAAKQEDVFNMSIAHLEIADTYFHAKEFTLALKHIEEAYRLSSEQKRKYPLDDKYPGEIASFLNKYGEILSAKGDFSAALQKYEEALQIFQNLGFKFRIANSLLNIANVYLQEKRYDLAEAQFKECLKYDSSFQNRDYATLYSSLGDLYSKQGKKIDADKAYRKSLATATKYDFKDISQKCSYQLFLLAFDRHDNTHALNYLNVSNALNDSLFNEQKTKRIAEMELKFDTEKHENEILALKHHESNLLMNGAIAGFTLILGFLAYIIRMRGISYKALQLKTKEIEVQYRRLEESNEILSQFAYVAAHDLKEPLRSIGSYIGLIQMKYAKDMPDDAKKYMTFVNAGVKRMYLLLTDLLDFSQVITQEAGTDIVHPDEVLEDVKNNLRSAIDSRNAVIEYSSDMPSIQINRIHLLQLFQNLIGNALKFSQENPLVQITIKEENGQALLTVKDNGIGIKKEYSSKIFVLFQQLNKKEQFEGTGIGLTICKNIVEKYNGKIWFDSEENIGTTFFISIPKQAAWKISI